MLLFYIFILLNRCSKFLGTTLSYLIFKMLTCSMFVNDSTFDQSTTAQSQSTLLLPEAKDRRVTSIAQGGRTLLMEQTVHLPGRCAIYLLKLFNKLHFPDIHRYLHAVKLRQPMQEILEVWLFLIASLLGCFCGYLDHKLASFS